MDVVEVGGAQRGFEDLRGSCFNRIVLVLIRFGCVPGTHYKLGFSGLIRLNLRYAARIIGNMVMDVPS